MEQVTIAHVTVEVRRPERWRRFLAAVSDGCVFRRNQPPIPIETSHLFRSKPAGHSEDASRG
jgi:hypothetical protein